MSFAKLNARHFEVIARAIPAVIAVAAALAIFLFWDDAARARYALVVALIGCVVQIRVLMLRSDAQAEESQKARDEHDGRTKRVVEELERRHAETTNLQRANHAEAMSKKDAQHEAQMGALNDVVVMTRQMANASPSAQKAISVGVSVAQALARGEAATVPEIMAEQRNRLVAATGGGATVSLGDIFSLPPGASAVERNLATLAQATLTNPPTAPREIATVARQFSTLSTALSQPRAALSMLPQGDILGPHMGGMGNEAPAQFVQLDTSVPSTGAQPPAKPSD